MHDGCDDASGAANVKRATTPFRFRARLTLTVATGHRASTHQELLEGIQTLPESVIYQHTHNFVQQHEELVPEPPNDFAVWARQALRDERLYEALAAIDTVRLARIADLRRALVAVVEEHVGRHGQWAVQQGQEFHFTRAVRFSTPSAHEAWTLAEFAEALGKVSQESLYLHVFEARLRLPRGVNDFSHWLDKELHEEALAARIADLDPYSRTLEGLRSALLDLVRGRLAEPE
jgi:uncharacterized protein DUF5752